MEYKQVKYIMEENVQLKAEIERLKAALQEIGHHRITPENKDYIAAHEMAIMAQHALGLVDSDGRPSQQQPEPPQESLEIRILRTLAASQDFVKYSDLTSAVKLGGLLSTLSTMIAKGWVKQRNGYAITAAGRDYLASLEATKAE